ncbi:MAG TPA: metallophosphoesterase [Longimicrobiaceae bacterium]|nr:metallophosphoesterase [Longimicrobiaceae bacterium]
MTDPEAMDPSETTPPVPERRHGDRRRSDRRSPRVRIAAVGDIHVSQETAGKHRALLARANDEADVLLVAGDLTRHGTAAEMRTAVTELSDVTIPIVAVLGNHDYEAGEAGEACDILRAHGVHLLDGDAFRLNEQVGIAGAKGYMGGFGRRRLTSFGEPSTKEFVAVCMEEVHKLELALQSLSTPTRIALLHYAPISETIEGEPEQIFPFLGTDRLAEPLDRYEAAVCFHGHAHRGSFSGHTQGGVPVFNVAHEVLHQSGAGEAYFLYELPLETEEEEEEPVEAGSAGA